MNTLKQLYQWLERQQERLAIQIVLSVLTVFLCALVFGNIVLRAGDVDHRRELLHNALVQADLSVRNEHAQSLLTDGALYLEDTTYSLSEQDAERAEDLFAENGRIYNPIGLTMYLLAPHMPTWIPKMLLESPITTTLLGSVAMLWLLAVIWLRIGVPCVLTLFGTGIPWGIAYSMDATAWQWAIGGFGLLLFTYLMLVRLFLVAYGRPQQTMAVAATVLREATRTRVPLIFIMLLLVLLPLIPVSIDADAPLRFRIQSFIARSMGLTFYLAAAMTIVLACSTVAFEIRDRQIWQLMTKPMGRLNYLLGKWVGIVTVNLILVTIASVSIFSFIQYQRQLPVRDGLAGREDALEVQHAVLTARIGKHPDYDLISDVQTRARVEELVRSDPELSILEEVPLAKRRELRGKVYAQFDAGQRSILPGQARDFMFTGLEAARASGSSLTLRYRFHILRDDEHERFPALFVFNDDIENMSYPSRYVPTMAHVLHIPPVWVQEDGTLKLTLVNQLDPNGAFSGSGAMNWEFDDFELLYKVSNFESNFLRAVLIDLIKLSFLAMLGICCATFLSFPVACLMSFTIFLAGIAGPYLASSLRDYVPPDAATMDWTDIGLVIKWIFMTALRVIAEVVVWLLDSFGQYRPTQALVEGRLVSWGATLATFIRIGVVWSGLTLAVGWTVLRNRQLAIYSGHG